MSEHQTGPIPPPPPLTKEDLELTEQVFKEIGELWNTYRSNLAKNKEIIRRIRKLLGWSERL